ncbi:MAG: hypothetical protein OSA97_08555, partial [Nevskia sp.]|nr:hypothetical protein [Nevskia sp.]
MRVLPEHAGAEWARRCVALGWLVFAPCAAAAEVRSLEVSRDGARYRVEMQVELHAAAAAAYAAFTVPANLPRINPAVRQVRVVRPRVDDQAQLYTEVRVCALLYCKTLHQLQDLRYAPRPDGGDLHADVLPGSSDFSYGRADWQFRPAGAAAGGGGAARGSAISLPEQTVQGLTVLSACHAARTAAMLHRNQALMGG